MSGTKNREARIFSVETNFQRMARRPGGIPRDQAIKQAETRIENFKPGFTDWLSIELHKLAAVINDAYAGTGKTGWIEIANAQSCQLRDIGTTMDFELLTFIADSLCEVLGSSDEAAEYDFDSIRCHLDALFLAQQEPYRHLKPHQVPELTSGLKRVAEHVRLAPSSTPE